MWNNGRHPPMPARERAKQFVPFAAVRGLEEALREREHHTEGRVEMQTDAAEELDRFLHELRAGDEVRLTYFAEDRYVTHRVCISDVCGEEKLLITQDGKKISFLDLRCIEKIF